MEFDMKIKIIFEGDFFEDNAVINDIMNFNVLKSNMNEIYNEIRSRIKYNDDMSEEEERFLRNLLNFTDE